MPQQKQKMPPDMTAVLQELVRHIFVTLNCVQVGKVEAFNATDQTVDVTLQIKQIKEEDAQGKPVFAPVVVMAKFPALILSGGDSYLSFPISAGDDCIILFNDRDIDNWFQNGGGNPPNTYRCHDASDGFVLVGIKNLQNSIANYLVNGIRMFLNSETKIDMTDNLISSLADMFLHTGNMKVTKTLEVVEDVTFDANHEVKGNITVDGNMTIKGHMKGNGGTITLDDDVVQTPGKTFKAGNGATGTYDHVTVVDGIVVSGS